MLLAAVAPPPFDAVVTKIVDGDTINAVIPGNPQEIKIRLACVDSPEPKQPGGKESGAYLSKTVPPGSVIQVIPVAPNDRYDRTLAFVTAASVNINLQQVKAGQAWFDPNYIRTCPQYAKILEEAEAEAKINSAGLWNGNPCPPWVWRVNKCAVPPDCIPTEN